jgi:hypothetical protein
MPKLPYKPYIIQAYSGILNMIEYAKANTKKERKRDLTNLLWISMYAGWPSEGHKFAFDVESSSFW